MGKLLIVDDFPDEPDKARHLHQALAGLGHEILTAEDGRGILDLAEAERPDIVLVDLDLRETDGIELCQRLKASPRLNNVSVVLLSANDDEKDVARGLDAGADDVIHLPFNDTVFAARLRAALRAKASRDALERVGQEELVERDDFLFHVSHELRTPLSAVYQFVTNVADGLAGEVTTDQRDCLDVAIKNVNQIEAMLKDLVEVTRVGTGKLLVERRALELRDVVSEMATGLGGKAAAKHVRLEKDVPDGVPSVLADPTRVRQILYNLLDNAIKFTPPGGTVVVSVSPPKDSEEFVCLTVRDTGCGIKADVAQRIFDRFYQGPGQHASSRPGLGLGLYIAQELVLRQGGRIWLDTELGKGSAFSFTLPLASASEATGADSGSLPDAAGEVDEAGQIDRLSLA